MNCLCYLLLFLLKVNRSICQNSQLYPSIINNHDLWIWGYSDSKVDNRNNDDTTSATPKSAVQETNPCDPFVRTKPKFEGRISEIKCQEHIWNLKYDAEKRIHDVRCETWNFEQKPKTNKLRTGNRPAVIGGRKTVIGEFPHMGAIGWKGVQKSWVFLCGSTLISSKFVLTAAHCSSTSPADTSIEDITPKIVRFKSKNLNKYPVEDINILRIIVHPNYQSPKKNYDIALMELERQVEFNFLIQPACLWAKPDLRNFNKVIVTGWGVLQQNSQDFSEELQTAEMDIIEECVCNESLSKYCNRNWCGLQDHQFCAGKLAGGTDACQGDSGGPLQVRIPLPSYVLHKLYYVIGVTSFGVSCAQLGLPGIYSRVSSFMDWIEPIVWP